ncbi:MAG: Holliday junction ATP-dependent DNA helicase ruvA [uncultured bacterium]|nr:MAG: Holliday junction ATP-dependent DNA helicase ruvA [uncultured bacterium]KKT74280.1 MAG: Holliday junction ATP-dependent DNA helicase RuvA [Candidatus Peregrinibacteria bacterium GW2011_GWA2_44_7]
MIAYLKGKILKKKKNSLIIENNGVGYKVFVPALLFEKSTYETMIELEIHTVVREDDWSLYGFETSEQLELFEQLISVSGIGPKTALEVFTLSVEKIKRSILNKEVETLKKIPGIGKKTAERLILELRGKLGSLDSDHLPETEPESAQSIQPEVSEALFRLGYHQKDLDLVFRSLQTPLARMEDMVTYFLKNV